MDGVFDEVLFESECGLGDEGLFVEGELLVELGGGLGGSVDGLVEAEAVIESLHQRVYYLILFRGGGVG